MVTGIAFLCSIVGNGLWALTSRALPLTLVGQMIVFETMFTAHYGFLFNRARRGTGVLTIDKRACGTARPTRR